MRYKDVTCIACGEVFTDESDVVVCPVCGAPHHRDCWTAAGQCAMHQAHENGYTWIFPEEILQAQAKERSRERAAARGDAEETGDIKLRNGENIITCPKCGSPNYENDIYCLRCGARLDDTGDGPADDPDAQQPQRTGFFGGFTGSDEQYQTIRDDFDRFGGISPDALVDGIPCGEYSDYVGGARPGRIIRKVSTMERYGRKFSWMWPALFFGPIWFFWRKMKKEGAVLSILLVFLAALFGVVQLDSASVTYYKQILGVMEQTIGGELSITDMQERVYEYAQAYETAALETLSPVRAALINGLEYSILFGIPVCCALIAMPLYRKKVKNGVFDIRERCTNMEQYKEMLLAEGGTSAGLAVIGVIVCLMAFFCAVYLPIVIVAVFK